MTGCAGGPMGGNAGASFGSGLTAFTQSPKKVFSPNLEKWTRAAEQDTQLGVAHSAEYDELKGMRTSNQKAREGFRKKSRASANDAFQRRQRELAAAEAAEKSRQKQLRAQALAKPTLGDMHFGTADYRSRLEAKSVLDETAVARWLYPTEKAVGDDKLVFHGLSAEHGDAMRTLPQNAMLSTVEKYVSNLVENTRKLTKERAAVRKHKDAERDALLAKEQHEREAIAIAMRQEVAKAAAAAEAASVTLAYATKKEMAAAASKQHQVVISREKSRFDKGSTQRKENQHQLHLTETQRLRSECEIANERREGSSMSAGGKDEMAKALRAAMEDGNVDKDEAKALQKFM